jgi:hypothetical protein
VSTWKQLAIKLFPEHNRGSFAFSRPDMSIYQVFFMLQEDARLYIKTGNREGLARIFRLVEWCFEQRKRNGDIWNAAATAFLEHLADDDETAAIIPAWVKPDIFLAMRNEFMKRRDRTGEGKYQELVAEYNRVNVTDFQ